MSRTISSPGVNVTETDQTATPAAIGGTSVLIPGFAQFGPSDTVLNVSSMTEFERLYGAPTNAAERYFHQSARAVFNSRSSILATRLPYGSGGGLGYQDNIYTALFYPVYPVHEESVAGHAASRTGMTAGEAGVFTHGTGMSAASAAFTASNSNYGLGGPGVSLSGVAGDTRLTFSDAWGDGNAATHYEGLSAGYIIGKPQLLRMSKYEYQDLQENNFTWRNFVNVDKTFASNDKATWGHAGIIITNVSKSIINDKYEGHYIGITDNSQVNPATDFDSVMDHFTVSETSSDLSLEVPKNRRNFPLSGTAISNDNSTSEILEEVSSIDLSPDDFNDVLILGIFRMRSTVYSTDTLLLDQTLVETHIGSLDSRRRLQSPAGGNPGTFFLGDVEKNSQRVEIMINPFISFENPTWTNPNGNLPTKFVRMLTKRAKRDAHTPSLSGSYGAVDHTFLGSLTGFGFGYADNLIPLGDYAKQNNRTKEIGSIPDKLDRAFRSIENLDIVPIDVSIEAGLGSIYAAAKYNQGSLSLDPAKRDIFDDHAVMKLGTVDHDLGTATGLYQTKEGVINANGTDDHAYDMIVNYKSVADKFVNFAEFNRRDHLYIADGLRNIFVQGENGKVMTFDKRRTFTQFVYWPLRHLFSSYNSSYMCTYGNWGKTYDGLSDRSHWCPFSGMAAGAMSNTDAAVGPWMAPAGFTRGRFAGASDLATIQSQKHRDQLYKININPVTGFPNDGYVIFGQKTMQRKPSAFDRINVRRLFLALEKTVRNSMKYYVFEPNTFLTRTKVLNTLTPVFNRIRNEQGIYDYLVVCDRRNNGSSIIDANELVVDIYIQPVRTAETILVNFYATRTGQDFSEIVS